MTTLYIPVGLPASGKSTLARLAVEPDAIVSPDEYRRILTGDMQNQDANKDVFAICHALTRGRLSRGLDVWFDATNLTIGAVGPLVHAARVYHAVSTIVVMTTPMLECFSRNEKRERPVPKHIMMDMGQKLLSVDHSTMGADVFMSDRDLRESINVPATKGDASVPA